MTCSGEPEPPRAQPHLGAAIRSRVPAARGEPWTCKSHPGIFLGGSGKAVPEPQGPVRLGWQGLELDWCSGNAVWLGPRPQGGGHWSGLSPHPCRRLTFQRQARQRLLCWGLLGTALHGTHWAHSPAGPLGEVSGGSARAAEAIHALLCPRDSPNSAPTPTAQRAQGMLTLMLSRI